MISFVQGMNRIVNVHNWCFTIGLGTGVKAFRKRITSTVPATDWHDYTYTHASRRLGTKKMS